MSFRLETDRVTLSWSGEERLPQIPLVATPRWGVSLRVDAQTGAALSEQTDYRLYLRATGRVILYHRDPVICCGLIPEENGRVLHGSINFGSQIGRSRFTVIVDDQPEFDFEVEVFPTKLDYLSDYQRLLSEVQSFLTGLALEYLRPTCSSATPVSNPVFHTHVEWLAMLREHLELLEQAARQIARAPLRGLNRRQSAVRADMVRKVDCGLLRAVERGRGTGRIYKLNSGLSVRERLPESTARETLDIPEHRWLRAGLEAVRLRLGRLRSLESARAGVRAERVVEELEQMEARLDALARSEPFAAARSDPPAGFASLGMGRMTGYREAHQALTSLRMGLKLGEGVLETSVKELSLLYEYWCYMALLRMLCEEMGVEVPARQLFQVRQHGLHTLLEKGRTTTINLNNATVSVELTYNPRYTGGLIPQQPDIMLALRQKGWPPLYLLLDAKYRIETAPGYIARYGAPGPPEDALNVLHRYRDAILEQPDKLGSRPKRAVVQAVVLFPFVADAGYRRSRLWQSLESVGIGAVPMLPGAEEYLRTWLRAALLRGIWETADTALDHTALSRSRELKEAACEPVLIGVLRAANPSEHLEWIATHRTYYTPLLRHPAKQLLVRTLALYSPATLSPGSAVTHTAVVEKVEVLARAEIQTPWSSDRRPDELQAVYRLKELQPLPRPIPNTNSQRFSTHRWTSRLALEKATTLSELLLATESEWRLCEALRAARIPFQIRATSPPTFLLQSGYHIQTALNHYSMNGQTMSLPQLLRVLLGD